MFSCGPSTNVATYLTIYLGIAPIGHDQKALALFYFYSTPLIPRNNGFRISSGPTASFSCDVNGMVLDYSGPPKDIPGAHPAARVTLIRNRDGILRACVYARQPPQKPPGPRRVLSWAPGAGSHSAFGVPLYARQHYPA